MSPAAVLIVAFVVADSGVEAAVHDRAGTLASFRFTNTQQGIVALARWMDNLPSAGKYTTAHACIVSLRSDEGELYSTPVFQFAYEMPGDMSVWSRAKLQRVVGEHSTSTTEHFLIECEREGRIK